MHAWNGSCVVLDHACPFVQWRASFQQWGPSGNWGDMEHLACERGVWICGGDYFVPASPMLNTWLREHASMVQPPLESARLKIILSVYFLFPVNLHMDAKINDWWRGKYISLLRFAGARATGENIDGMPVRSRLTSTPRCRRRTLQQSMFRCYGGHAISAAARQCAP